MEPIAVLPPPVAKPVENMAAPIEDLLAQLPLCDTPLGRLVVFGTLGGAVAYVVRPSMSFKPDGTPRPFALFNPTPDSAVFPWWGWIVVPSVLFGVLI